MPNKDDDKIINDSDKLLEEAEASRKKAVGDFERFDGAISETDDENEAAQSELDREISEIIKGMEVATDEFENDLGSNE